MDSDQDYLILFNGVNDQPLGYRKGGAAQVIGSGLASQEWNICREVSGISVANPLRLHSKKISRELRDVDNLKKGTGNASI